MHLMKKSLRWIVASLAGVLILEGLCSFYWLARDRAAFRRDLPRAIHFSEESHVRYDADLGWVNIPGKRLQDFYGPGKHLTINSQGFRGNEEILAKPPDRFRLICLGDSFTLGYGVDDRDTWPACLERLRPGVQTVNMGSGGYSIGQCSLWLQRDGSNLQPDAIVLAFVVEDVWRMAGERMINGCGKPTFRLREGLVEVGNQPVPAKIETGRMITERWKTLAFLDQHGGLLRSLSRTAKAINAVRAEPTAQEQLAVALKLIEEMQARLAREKIPFALILLPDLAELTDAPSQRIFQQVAAKFEAIARQNHIPFLCLLGGFAADSSPRMENLFNMEDPWQHYSPAGYQLVAREIDLFLSANLERYPAH